MTVKLTSARVLSVAAVLSACFLAPSVATTTGSRRRLLLLLGRVRSWARNCRERMFRHRFGETGRETMTHGKQPSGIFSEQTML